MQLKHMKTLFSGSSDVLIARYVHAFHIRGGPLITLRFDWVLSKQKWGAVNLCEVVTLLYLPLPGLPSRGRQSRRWTHFVRVEWLVRVH